MTDEFTARCEWDDTGWWVVTVPGLAGAVSQARRLDQVPQNVVEVVSLLTGSRPRPDDVTIDPHFPGPAGEAAARARALRVESDRLVAEAQEAAVSAVHALRAAGLTMRDIGVLVGMSYQRVQQILVGAPARAAERAAARAG